MRPEEAAERVLVVPAAVFRDCGYFEGFSNQLDKYEALLGPKFHTFLPRGEVEDNPGWKQLIPYIVVRRWDPDSGSFYLAYERGRKQADERLRGNLSIGFGGHIREDDGEMLCCTRRLTKHPGMLKTFQALERPDILSCGMLRELFEEVEFSASPPPPRPHFAGLINEDRTVLGRVHLGLVWLVDTTSTSVMPADHNIRELLWLKLGTLVRRMSQYEPWSQIAMLAREEDILVGWNEECQPVTTGPESAVYLSGILDKLGEKE